MKVGIILKHYNVEEAFQVLKQNKITTNKESVRRWLREGTIKGITPASRKSGWLIREDNLYSFIYSRLPDDRFEPSCYTTNDVNEIDKEKIRAEMWWEIARKNIFEDFLEIKKTQVQDCIQHKRYSKAFERYAWDTISKHKRGYQTPRVPYLLDAFLFNGNRIKMNDNYELLQEKILYALIEHLRKRN